MEESKVDSLIELAKIRLKKAHEAIKESKILMDNASYQGSINRSYYAVFYTLCAVCAVDEHSTKSHKGVISHFSYEYLKDNKLDRELGRIANEALDLRQDSDYNDFFEPTIEEAEQQYNGAVLLMNDVELYLYERFEKMKENELELSEHDYDPKTDD